MSQQTTPNAPGWTPDSWRSKPIKQCPEYPDKAALEKATNELKTLPPIVLPNEIIRLREHLRDVAQGKAFLLQGGDCAELFSYCQQDVIESKIKLLLQMSLVLLWGADKPVVRIGRMAGQYAKPRSSPVETINGKEVPSFRGDILNGFHPDERELDPNRLVRAYQYSSATLNYIRGAIGSGIADLHGPLDWGLGHVRDPALKSKYQETVDRIQEMLRFMHTIGADQNEKLSTVELFTSHEGLLLEYEEPLTRLLNHPSVRSYPPDSTTPPKKEYYNTSAHFLWIGDRTRQIDHAHVEYFRGIANPIGVKIGPSTPTSDLLPMLRTLNPNREPGKVTLITRYGADKVASLLPAHIRTVESSEYARTVVWQCDPMHGNTQSVSGGIKTRKFSDIFSELQQTLRIHKEQKSYLGGMHLELTGDAVTECLGGGAGLDEDDLSTNYTSFCDPRLNEKQALELAFLVADHYRQERKEKEAERRKASVV
ncbi:Phospho-2-dehydro-3-deoxyheptonate aldolase [Neurospora tetrasperma FGSC 2508]|uniref:Phospho-2-dehydro-3-deoxyheptonate aldolase n=1 Tax=Neurospora tetrasperma (strain FGSC 2508 / ATCC MYA-4615 / P0657) TaxID=510951 RepID=F8MZJ5_NEUT8|nr:Phospho-2-dehydro-3-deoxyheptonate aldolase [Neurospora tetrasperma FGSC 2508]EGO53685.1 Phospho-2-dehydro-3-deoxyheptonate aldolase [Neurospora tetrasperma FGSC 2508]EGZ76243.1 phospho-2-dehydro-3-deoxyheptonate aldolase [Neurospora tetrasperma FGSC 2509]